MAVDAPGRTLGREEIDRMVRAAKPEWAVEAAALAPGGVTPVYSLRVETPTGRREVVLKAARPDDHPAVGDVAAEARLLSVVGERTTAPVPEVLGVVEDRETVRTPLFLMESLSGSELDPRGVGDLPEETLRRIARQSGRWLAQLHAVDFENVTAFGRGIECDPSTIERDGRPPSDPSALVLREGYRDIRRQLREWWAEDPGDGPSRHLNGLGPEIRATILDRVEEIPAAVEPTVARLDHGWHNLLLDDDRRITGVLDWGTLASFPPAYDLALVELRLAGGTWLGLSELPDRRETIREALLRGYREERSVPSAFAVQRRVYQLDVLGAWLASLGEEPSGPGVPERRAEEAAAGLRTVVADLLD